MQFFLGGPKPEEIADGWKSLKLADGLACILESTDHS
jgi:hypothetical protein